MRQASRCCWGASPPSQDCDPIYYKRVKYHIQSRFSKWHHIQSQIPIFSHKYPFSVTWLNMVQWYMRDWIWSCVTEFGHAWLNLVTRDWIWSCVTEYGHAWLNLVTRDWIWDGVTEYGGRVTEYGIAHHSTIYSYRTRTLALLSTPSVNLSTKPNSLRALIRRLVLAIGSHMLLKLLNTYLSTTGY